MITPAFFATATERVLPKLAIDFTTATLDPRVTLTRSLNTATRINASGLVEVVNVNLPRFDYDPTTLACKGLLIEESRINVCPYSQSFATWSKYSNTTCVDNQAVSPDGTNNASRLTCPGGGFQGVYQDIPTSAASYTFSVWLKSATGSNQSLRIYADGSVLSVNTTVTVTNTWQRFSVSGTVDTSSRVQIAVNSSAAAIDVYCYGAQMEAGAFATSYIPNLTTGTTTRNADVATMTGTSFSNWWQATAGSVVVSAQQRAVSGIRPWVQYDDNTANNLIVLRGNTTNPELYVKATTDQAQIDAGTIAASTSYNFGGAWNTNDCAAAVAGGAAVTDSSAIMPIVTQARLGSDGTNYLNGWLQGFRYWPQRIGNSEIQAFSK